MIYRQFKLVQTIKYLNRLLPSSPTASLVQHRLFSRDRHHFTDFRMDATPTTVPDERKERRKQKQEQKQKKQGPNTKGAAQQPSSKLRGNPLRDAPEVQISKTLSWMLRHGAKEEGLVMRPDGYAKVMDVVRCPVIYGSIPRQTNIIRVWLSQLANPKLKTLSFEALQEIVQADKKNRYGLLFEPDQDSNAPGIWWIRANQGHSIRVCGPLHRRICILISLFSRMTVRPGGFHTYTFHQ